MQSTPRPEAVTVLGAGLAGALLSLFLAQRGYPVDVYEMRPDMRNADISAGRSINLALSTRGTHALRQAGLYEEIMALTLPMQGRMIHPLDGALQLQRYGQKESEVIYSVSRGELNSRLLTRAEQHPNVRLFFNQRTTGMSFETRTLFLTDEQTGRAWSFSPAVVLAADGAGSAIRKAMMSQVGFAGTQDFLVHGYKELTIPPAADGSFRLDPTALHIWPRRTYMLIALPNLDGSFTCTLFLPYQGPESFESLTTETAVQTFFEAQFPDAVPLLPDLLTDFFTNPTGPLGTIRCAPWHVGGQSLLIGDAAHAIVPFFGQGMNCAFEDCTVLDACLETHPGDWKKVFATFEAERKKNTDAIAHMALDNYLEMRDRVADPAFLLRRKAGLALERLLPDTFIPMYSMVSFHRIPYAEALRRGNIQEEILVALCEGRTRLEEIDWTKAETLVLTTLSPSTSPN